MQRVVILGGGTGGAVAARRLGQWAREGEVGVVLVDRSAFHEYRPSYLWVMTGRREPDDVRRPLELLGPRYGTGVVRAEVARIDPGTRRVETDADAFDHDFLMLRPLRSPELAGALVLVVAVARALRAEPERAS